MRRDELAELFRQIAEGWDIPKPASALRSSQESANRKLECLPYSLAENLWHAVYWQRTWLHQLDGLKPPSMMEIWKGDWQTPSAKDWRVLRQEFVDGLEKARTIAQGAPFVHRCESDDAAVALLLRIAIHASYHIGQFNLLRQAAAQSRRESKSP